MKSNFDNHRHWSQLCTRRQGVTWQQQLNNNYKKLSTWSIRVEKQETLEWRHTVKYDIRQRGVEYTMRVEILDTDVTHKGGAGKRRMELISGGKQLKRKCKEITQETNWKSKLKSKSWSKNYENDRTCPVGLLTEVHILNQHGSQNAQKVSKKKKKAPSTEDYVLWLKSSDRPLCWSCVETISSTIIKTFLNYIWTQIYVFHRLRQFSFQQNHINVQIKSSTKIN